MTPTYKASVPHHPFVLRVAWVILFCKHHRIWMESTSRPEPMLRVVRAGKEDHFDSGGSYGFVFKPFLLHAKSTEEAITAYTFLAVAGESCFDFRY